jgi:hypothetical protein
MPVPWTLIATTGFFPTNHDWRVPEKFLEAGDLGLNREAHAPFCR